MYMGWFFICIWRHVYVGRKSTLCM